MSATKRCNECHHKFDKALSYCPECEAYHDTEREQDIKDKYDDYNPNVETLRQDKPYKA